MEHGSLQRALFEVRKTIDAEQKMVQWIPSLLPIGVSPQSGCKYVWRHSSRFNACLVTCINHWCVCVQGQIGQFPDCLEAIMLGKERYDVDRLKRRAAVVRVIMRKLFTGLKRIHSLGLVHRDVGLNPLPHHFSSSQTLQHSILPALGWITLSTTLMIPFHTTQQQL